MAALALAWVAKNPNTGTVILGASKPEQLIENLKALEVIPKLTPEILHKIDKILDNTPDAYVCAIFLLFPLSLTRWLTITYFPQPTHGRPMLDRFGRL